MAARKRKEIDTSAYTGRFAERLKMLREKAGLSPQKVADAIGVTLRMIYLYEEGSNSPKLETFPIIAKLYKLKKTRDLLPNE